MKLATRRVNGRSSHFATTPEKSQHIDEFLVVPTQAGANHVRVLALLAKQFDGLTERNCAFGGNLGALLSLGQACSAMRQRIGCKRRRTVGTKLQECQ
jgi:hypothetical protein